jgi:hypothetical protein
MKTLYHLHIPKCGGQGFRNLIPILEDNGLKVFSRTTTPFEGYDKYSFVHTHYGSDPSDNYPEIETACIFRDPLDRMVSQFAWAMMTEAYSYPVFSEYTKDNIETLFRHFLFTDENFANNNNLQTKFVCNRVDKGHFYISHIGGLTPEGNPVENEIPYSHGIFAKEWALLNDRTSIEYAKSQVDKMTIIDTMENHDRFVTNICNWFKENYDLDIEEEFRASLVNEDPTFNYSKFTDNQGTEWTTAKLKALLTQEEIARVYENCSLDLELYNYVKGKVS